jgi:hypothetical protein
MTSKKIGFFRFEKKLCMVVFIPDSKQAPLLSAWRQAVKTTVNPCRSDLRSEGNRSDRLLITRNTYLLQDYKYIFKIFSLAMERV